MGKLSLIAFPGAPRFRELIGDGFGDGIGSRGDGLNAIDIIDARRASGLIGCVHCNRLGIRSRTGYGANVGARRACRKITFTI